MLGDLQPYRSRWDGGMRSLEAGYEHSAGPVVVLVPGLGALGYLMDTLAGCGAWARSFLLDVPGFGHRLHRCSAEIPTIADAVSGWVRAVVSDAPVVLVGHSTGAQSALRVAAQHPDQVGTLVLMGPTFPPEQRRFPGLVEGLARSSGHEPPGLQGVTVPYYLRGGVRDIARYVRSAQSDEPERTIADVCCPVVLVRGEHDGCAPAAWMDRLAAATPHLAWAATTEGAHAFPFRRGGRTAALIARAAHNAGAGTV